jgi:hypothetical protein
MAMQVVQPDERMVELFPEATVKKPRRKNVPVPPTDAEFGIQVEIVKTADRNGYRLKHLYYLAFKEHGRFTFEGLSEESLGNILAALRSKKDLHIEANLCSCGKRAPHWDDCNYRKLLRLVGE